MSRVSKLCIGLTLAIVLWYGVQFCFGAVMESEAACHAKALYKTSQVVSNTLARL